MKKTGKRTKRQNSPSQIDTTPEKATFLAHFRELRKRFFYTAIAVGAGAGLAYTFQSELTAWLLAPAGAQQFIYTTPGGGFDFQFKLCLYAGIALGIPVIIYHLGKYLQPLLRQQSKRFVHGLMLASSILALIGISFGYFVGLPAAMHFLLQSFSSDRIAALITIQSYMSFVMVYLLGSALLFQIPLIMILINRLKPLKPSKLFTNQRWFLIAAFVMGAIISPTPDIRNQLLLTGPIILTYELSIVLIWIINRRHQRPKKVLALLEKDAMLQDQRQQSFQKAHEAWRASRQPSHMPVAATSTARTAVRLPKSAPTQQPQLTSRPFVQVSTSTIVQPRSYVQDFTRRTI